ncbi:unnamed protein product [Ostreobium quekettii]|uniref:Uncharacterized protein n=1 Tax=Ostreobium quekettii TaxID=121088 RepID=A0A8S1J3M8_9CHLO|nr:unnamed protein product [Ostreobium quekettii]
MHWSEKWRLLDRHFHPMYDIALVELLAPTPATIPVFSSNMTIADIPPDVPLYALLASIGSEYTHLRLMNRTEVQLATEGGNSRRMGQCSNTKCVQQQAPGAPLMLLDYPPRQKDPIDDGSHEHDLVVAMATTDACGCTSYVLMRDVMGWVRETIAGHEKPLMQALEWLCVIAAIFAVGPKILNWLWRPPLRETDATMITESDDPGLMRPDASDSLDSPYTTPQGSGDDDEDGYGYCHKG